MSTPQSVINICSGVRLDSRYEHSIYFSSKSAQEGYFAGKVVKTFSAYSFLRKSWPIKVEATMEQAKTWNYLYFRNFSSGKVYYYFINQVEYINDSTVELTLELDVIQTYMFDFSLLPCFVERQHTTTDGIGDHTVDEGLEVGELIDQKMVDWSDLESLCILVLATINPNYADTEKPIQALAGNYDGVFSGLKVWAVNATKWADWGNKLDDLSEAGFADGIISMWMYPKALVDLGGENTWDDTDLCKTVDGCADITNHFYPFEPPGTLDGYTPKNKKTLCYPFNFLYVTNNMGGSAVYRYERFTTYNRPYFTVKGTIAPEGSVKMFPADYNQPSGSSASLTGNYDRGMTLTGFPACAWDSDIYKMWLAQNQNQHAFNNAVSGVKIAGGALSAVGSLMTGNVLGAVGSAGSIISGATQIGQHLAQKADMEIQPPQSKGSFSGNINVSAGKQTFTFYQKCVNAEHAKIIDDYFTMYGYKLNRVQTPNIHARPSFTYVKTIGCHIQGNMCTEDIVKVESIFDQGITFWANGDKVADYSQNNTV